MYRQAIAEIWSQLNRTIFFLILFIVIESIFSLFSNELIKFILMFGILLILYVYCGGFINKIRVTSLQDWLNGFTLINMKIIYDLIIFIALLVAIYYIITSPMAIITFVYDLTDNGLLICSHGACYILLFIIDKILITIVQYIMISGLAYMMFYKWDTSKSLISGIKLILRKPSVDLVLLIITIFLEGLATLINNAKIGKIISNYLDPLKIPFIIIVLFIYFKSIESAYVQKVAVETPTS